MQETRPSLKASGGDGGRPTSIDLLIIADFAVRELDATQTNDFHEIVAERAARLPRSGCRIESGTLRIAWATDQRRPPRPLSHRSAPRYKLR